MPLSDQGRPVAVGLEDVGQRGRVGRDGQRAPVGDRFEDAEPARTATGQERRTGRRAGRADVMALEPDARRPPAHRGSA